VLAFALIKLLETALCVVVTGRTELPTFRFSGQTYPQLAQIVRELCAAAGCCCCCHRCCQPRSGRICPAAPWSPPGDRPHCGGDGPVPWPGPLCYPGVAVTTLGGPPDRARGGHDHGSGGRLSNLANVCLLPAGTRSLVAETARFIPRIFRILETGPVTASLRSQALRSGPTRRLGPSSTRRFRPGPTHRSCPRAAALTRRLGPRTTVRGHDARAARRHQLLIFNSRCPRG